MALIVDAGALYAHADADDSHHAEVVIVLDLEREALITSEFVVAEADYLIARSLGTDAELAFLEDLASGAYSVECLTRAELAAARDLAIQYRDLRLGIADASLVVLAHRFRTNRLLTFDQRAFRPVRPIQGGSFVVLPADRRSR